MDGSDAKKRNGPAGDQSAEERAAQQRRENAQYSTDSRSLDDYDGQPEKVDSSFTDALRDAGVIPKRYSPEEHDPD